MGLFGLCAAVLHLGQVAFAQTSKGDAFMTEPGGADAAAELLGVKATGLVDALCEPRVFVGGEWIKQSRNLDQVPFFPSLPSSQPSSSAAGKVTECT